MGLLLLAGGLAPAQQPPPLPPVPPAAWRPSAPDSAPAPLPPLPAATNTAPVRKASFHLAPTPALPGAQAVAAGVVQVQAMQPQRGGGAGASNEQMDYLIQLLPPSKDRMFRIMNEDALREQIRQELREGIPRQPAVFPEEHPVTVEPYAARDFEAQVTLVEPNYVNYKRLYFEDVNTERYGWELGFAQPAVSAGLFFVDVALLPYHFASRPLDCVESSAGYCLPDSPVPYLLYPPDLSTTGALGEAGAILGLIAIFP